MTVGEVLRKRRKLNNLTLKQLSANCGISLVHLSNIENSKKDPRYNTLEKIANSYNLDVADMLRDPITSMTDVELMQKCVVDAQRIIIDHMRIDRPDIADDMVNGKLILQPVCDIAVELFNFRSERLGMQLKATGIPADNIPF